jgi:hypothetical protein
MKTLQQINQEYWGQCCSNCVYFQWGNFSHQPCKICERYSKWENGTDPLLVKAIRIMEKLENYD